jgi:Zn-dependent protease with chaperone function
MKKIFFSLLILFFVLNACSKKQETAMDRLAKDNLYHYVNEDLKFSIDLPKEFIYYQTQREETND